MAVPEIRGLVANTKAIPTSASSALVGFQTYTGVAWAPATLSSKVVTYSAGSYSGWKYVPKRMGINARTGILMPTPLVASRWKFTSHSGAGNATVRDSYNRVVRIPAPFHDQCYTRGVPALRGYQGFSTAELNNAATSIVLDATGHMPPNAALLVDLAEIGQTLAMVKSVQGWLKWLPSGLRKLEEPCIGANLQDTLRKHLNTTLCAKFGVEPLMDTITALLQWEEEVVKRLRVLMDRNASGKPFRLSRTLSKRTNIDNPVAPKQGGWVATNGLITEKVHMRCMADVTYDGLSSAKATASLTADYLGLNRLASVAWELTPFSFIYDWAANLGWLCEAMDSTLSKHTTGIPTTGIGIYGASYTITQSQLIRYEALYGSQVFTPVVRLMGMLHGKRLVRSMGLPLTTVPDILVGSGWNFSKTSTGTELAIQRFLRK